MEKGLTYYDLAENDYQFLLKDWQDGRGGNIMCASVQAFMKTHQHKGTPINEEITAKSVSTLCGC